MRVKTLSTLVVAVTGMMLSVAAQAQDAPAGGEAAPATPPPAAPAPAPTSSGDARGLVGVDFALAIPFGNLSDGAGIGLGGLVRGEYGIIPNLNLTARVGYIYHLGKDVYGTTINYSEIPVLFGGKYGFTDAIYGAAEIGFVRGTASAGGISASETNAAFTIGAGYRMGDLDFRLGLNILDLGHAGDNTELMINVGYNFLKF